MPAARIELCPCYGGRHCPAAFGAACPRTEVGREPLGAAVICHGCCCGTTRKHDRSVVSVGVTLDGDLDLKSLNWLRGLLRSRGQDIFRSQGILAVSGKPRRWVFQGVHMLFDGADGPDREPGEVRTSRLVIIGRGLDRD